MSTDFIFGLHSVSAFLERNPQDVLELFVLKDRDDQRMTPLIQQARKLGISVQFCQRKTLDEKVEGAQHQGVVAKARLSDAGDEHDLKRILDTQAQPFLLILDGITDPHNLGAILRSADAAGVHAVIAPKDRAAKLTAVVRKVACGAAEAVPFIAVTNCFPIFDSPASRICSAIFADLAGLSIASIACCSITGCSRRKRRFASMNS